MNKTHRLASGKSKNKKVALTNMPKPNKNALINLCLALLFGVILCIVLYTPFRYSTVANNKIVKQITDNITGTYGGIVASNEPVTVEDYDLAVKSSQDFIMDNGDRQLNYLKRFEELGILRTNVDIDDLWAVYYAYFSSDYSDNLTLYKQLVTWYGDLNKVDNADYVNTCVDNECMFIKEMSNIINLDETTIINSNAHTTYHAQIEESEKDLALTENDMQQAYEAYILSNPDYIESLTVDFSLINQNLLNGNEQLANWALNTDNFAVTWMLGNIKHSTQFNNDIIPEVLQYINITDDDEIITDEIVAYVPNALLAYGADEDGLNTGNTTITNVTDVENWEEWLLEGNKTVYKNVSTDIQFIDLGFAKLYWDINSIDYKENIPTFEECSNNAEWVKAIRIQLIEQAVWQRFYSGE